MNYLLQIFQVVFVVSSIVICVWLFGSSLGRKVGYRWRKKLWFLLATILLIAIPLPFTGIMDFSRGVEIQLELPKEISVLSTVWNRQEGAYISIPDVSESADGNIENVNLQNMAEESTLPSENAWAGRLQWSYVIALIWGAGVLILFGIRVYQYRSLKKIYFRETIFCEEHTVLACRDKICAEYGIRKEIPVRVPKDGSRLLNSPMLFGYIRTVLLFPYTEYQTQELEAIMKHELTHYRSKDLWYKFLLMIVCDIYWFNPIFRLMEKMAFHDVEFVCDEIATEGFDIETKKSYSSTILRTMSGMRGTNIVFVTHFAGNKKSAKERFENIFATHNGKAGIIVLGVLIMIIAVGVIGVSISVGGKDTHASVENENGETVEGLNQQMAEKPEITIPFDILPENGKELLDSVQELYPNYKISSVDEHTQYRADTFFEQEPTLFTVSSLDILGLAQKGEIADITDILAKRGWLEQMDDAAKATVSDAAGRVYGIPMPSAYTYGVVVNVKMFEEAGLVDENGVPDFPDTWDELAQTAVAIKKATGQPGLCLIAGEDDYTGCVHFLNMVWNFGTTELITRSEDGRYETHLDSEEAIAAMEFVKDLKWEYDVLTEDPTQETYLSGYEHLAKGTAAMYLGANDALSLVSDYGMDVTELAMCAVPAGPGGQQYSCFGNAMYVFSADATEEEIDVALSVLETMGVGPVANDVAKDRIRTQIEEMIEAGGPAIKKIPVWKNSELLEYERTVLKELGNTNQALYEPYLSKVLVPGNLKEMDTVANSEMCAELSKVLKTVMTNPDANVAELMRNANENWRVFVEHYLTENILERGIAY